jgi:hypothetical protein
MTRTRRIETWRDGVVQAGRRIYGLSSGLDAGKRVMNKIWISATVRQRVTAPLGKPLQIII